GCAGSGGRQCDRADDRQGIPRLRGDAAGPTGRRAGPDGGRAAPNARDARSTAGAHADKRELAADEHRPGEVDMMVEWWVRTLAASAFLAFAALAMDM